MPSPELKTVTELFIWRDGGRVRVGIKRVGHGEDNTGRVVGEVNTGRVVGEVKVATGIVWEPLAEGKWALTPFVLEVEHVHDKWITSEIEAQFSAHLRGDGVQPDRLAIFRQPDTLIGQVALKARASLREYVTFYRRDPFNIHVPALIEGKIMEEALQCVEYLAALEEEPRV